MRVGVAGWAAFWAMVACANDGQEGSQEEVLSALETPHEAQPEAALPVTGDDSALRRVYGSGEMKLNECMKVQPDGSITGDQCPSAFVMFGPYITTPSNADVRLAFDIESSGKITVSSDVVSSLAKHFHGAMEETVVGPKEKRRIGYKIHFFQPADGVEARLWIKGDGPSNFQISNFGLEVK